MLSKLDKKFKLRKKALNNFLVSIEFLHKNNIIIRLATILYNIIIIFEVLYELISPFLIKLFIIDESILFFILFLMD
jgi:hypothetical protein